MKIYRLVFILMPVSILLAFLYAPSAEVLGHTSRIIYFHVPVGWVSVLAFMVAGIYSILYLKDRGRVYKLAETKAFNSAVIGIVFTVLTIVTGSIWAKLMWGSFWNWDPRETSMLILLLIYTAYFSLRSSITDSGTRDRVSSVYLIFAMVVVPFFVFVVPRIYPSLHPDTVINTDRKLHLDGDMRMTLFTSSIAFTMLYAYLFIIANRISKASKKIEERYDS